MLTDKFLLAGSSLIILCAPGALAQDVASSAQADVDAVVEILGEVGSCMLRIESKAITPDEGASQLQACCDRLQAVNEHAAELNEADRAKYVEVFSNPTNMERVNEQMKVVGETLQKLMSSPDYESEALKAALRRLFS